MKAGLPHRVPLSDRAVEILQSLPMAKKDALVFPGRLAGRALSQDTLNNVVKQIHDTRVKANLAGYLDPKREQIATVHGMRSTFTDWARTLTNYSIEAQELALAHVNTDATRAAYARDELLDIRRRLMRHWARFCEKPIKTADGTSANVISMRAQK